MNNQFSLRFFSQGEVCEYNDSTGQKTIIRKLVKSNIQDHADTQPKYISNILIINIYIIYRYYMSTSLRVIALT